jgi:hypothetical protein
MAEFQPEPTTLAGETDYSVRLTDDELRNTSDLFRQWVNLLTDKVTMDPRMLIGAMAFEGLHRPNWKVSGDSKQMSPKPATTEAVSPRRPA